MGKVNFCVDAGTTVVPEVTARAMAYELHISPKHAFEVCRALKGKKVEDAERYLEAVVAKKVVVPYKRHKQRVAHRRGLTKWYAGRYPVKTSAEILKLVRSAKKNAEYKGLDAEDMRIWHMATKQGRTIRGIFPRAFGRASPKNTDTVTIELIIREEGS